MQGPTIILSRTQNSITRQARRVSRDALARHSWTTSHGFHNYTILPRRFLPKPSTCFSRLQSNLLVSTGANLSHKELRRERAASRVLDTPSALCITTSSNRVISLIGDIITQSTHNYASRSAFRRRSHANNIRKGQEARWQRRFSCTSRAYTATA
jgi:hypothetical protein